MSKILLTDLRVFNKKNYENLDWETKLKIDNDLNYLTSKGLNTTQIKDGKIQFLGTEGRYANSKVSLSEPYEIKEALKLGEKLLKLQERFDKFNEKNNVKVYFDPSEGVFNKGVRSKHMSSEKFIERQKARFKIQNGKNKSSLQKLVDRKRELNRLKYEVYGEEADNIMNKAGYSKEDFMKTTRSGKRVFDKQKWIDTFAHIVEDKIEEYAEKVISFYHNEYEDGEEKEVWKDLNKSTKLKVMKEQQISSIAENLRRISIQDLDLKEKILNRNNGQDQFEAIQEFVQDNINLLVKLQGTKELRRDVLINLHYMGYIDDFTYALFD